MARCQSDSEEAVETVEGGDLGIVGEDAPEFVDSSFGPAPGVDTVCIFPKNSGRCEKFINVCKLIYLFMIWVVF